MQNHKEVFVAAEKVSYFKKDIRSTKEWACYQVHSFFVFVYVFPNWPGALLKISSMGEKINVFYKRIKYILCYKRGKKIKVTEKLFGKRTQKIKIIRRKFEWM
ncbi:hypothetical protein P7H20_10545 [Paenibacillus larvae]|nr:hypothetical protein [Paenibacillus larvae]MDT2263690.1 hypothetical protein [Paenibacillus larvae]MDT2275189.1 hypothetical protein [Paenibacillus larvae]